MFDLIYRSAVYHTKSIVDKALAGTGLEIPVIGGEAYGINLEEPGDNSNSVAVEVNGVEDLPIILGSEGTRFSVVCTITATDRRKRDYLTSIVYQGMRTSPFYVYERFVNFVPQPEESPDVKARAKLYNISQDNIQSFEDERFLWTSIVYSVMDILM